MKIHVDQQYKKRYIKKNRTMSSFEGQWENRIKWETTGSMEHLWLGCLSVEYSVFNQIHVINQ